MKLRHIAAALTLAISSAYAAPQSWLQQNLPPQTAAYLRLPNLWFLENHKLAASTAYQNDAYRAQTSAVRSALIQRLITLLPEEARAPLQNLQQHLDAPLEIALIQDKNELNLLIAASAAFPDEQTLQQTLAQTFPAPWKVSADRIEQRGAPTIAYRYDSSTQRLLLSTGLVKNPADSLKYLAEDGGDAPFSALQTRLDPEADGFYLWLDPQNPLLQQKLREYKPLLEKLGIDHAEQLALAWSVQNERPRLQISLVQPDNAPLNLPQATTDALKLPYQGDISALAALTLPNDAQIDGLADSHGKIKQTLQQALGISADDLAALGTIHYLADDNGSYLVLPQSAKPALEALLTKLQGRGILNKRETLQDGIEHLAFTSLAAQGAKHSEQDNVFKKTADTAFNTLMSQLQNHYYLRAEGDYLLISDLPQPLLARKNLAADAPTIADWLAKEHLDIQHSNYAYIQNQRHLSRDSYYNSLKRLQAYADLAQSPLDIMALPDASQLPASGAVALRLHGDGKNPTLTLDLQNGADDLLSMAGSSTTIATFGILSAIALPAYQDYVTRSHIQTGLNVAEPLKKEIAATLDQGKKIDAKKYKTADKNLRVEANGDIQVTLQNASRFDGKTITLHYDRASKQWQCQTDIAKRYLPQSCR